MADCEQNVSYKEYEGRNNVCDERFARDKERLDLFEREMREVRELTIQMGEILKRHDEQLSSSEERIKRLERQPADNYGKIKLAIATAVVSGLVGFAISVITTIQH